MSARPPTAPTRAGRMSMWKPDGHLVAPLDEATERLQPGAVLAQRYRIVDLLGEGGMGRVYEAVHVDLDKRFAVKLIRPGIGDARVLEDVFRIEARAASRIGHPNIIDVSDFGRAEDGALFMVMEFLAGESLRERLGRVHALPSGQALRILLQVAQALSAAHAARIVHRDMKPDNVLLTRRGEEDDFVKIIDFGLAHALGGPQGIVCGTPQYMAPEQASGGPHDQRVDVFSFGVTAYESLTGRLPYQITQPADVHTLLTQPRPRAPQDVRPGLFLAAPLADTLLRCLDPLPEGRPSSMEEVVWALIAAGAAPLETLAERESRRLGLTPPPQPVSSASPRPLVTPPDAFEPPTVEPMRRVPERVIEFRDAGPAVKLELAIDPAEPRHRDSRDDAKRDIERWRLKRLLVRLAWGTAAAIVLHQAFVRGWLTQLLEGAFRLLFS